MYLLVTIVNTSQVLYYHFIHLRYMAMSENQRDPQYKLRWSEELRDKIAKSAKASNRSMNADIIARLEQSFALFEENKVFANPEALQALSKSIALTVNQIFKNLEDHGVDKEIINNAVLDTQQKTR
jgi:hypothetical protein